MLKIGITGGIGSGKSLVSSIFEKLGIPVYFADKAAQELLNEEGRVKEQVKQAFGEKSYTTTGVLDRVYMANLVFNNEARLNTLNSIVHPAVAIHFQNWSEHYTTAPYILKEAAILFESGSHQGLDAVIVVTAPVETRIVRVMKRDGVTRDKVEKRLLNQWPEEEKVKRADFIIVNDGEELLIPQVVAIHQALVERSRKK